MHTGWELEELYITEQYWPTGEPADSLRCLMMSSIMAASQGDKEAERNARRIWRKLTGVADPAVANKKGMSAVEIRYAMDGFI